MPRPRYTPKPRAEAPTVPFDSAEEAWFWYARCQRLRREGARFRDDGGQLRRPCDPDDLYRAAVALLRGKRIHLHHVAVLAEYGLRDRPPDPRCGDEQRAARLWDEALDHLTTALRGKGIVA